MTVFLIATLDTKGPEAEFVRERLQDAGVDVALVDTGCMGTPRAQADLPRETVFEAAGTTLAEMRGQGDRAVAVDAAALGAAALVAEAHADGRVSGVMGLGGSAGTVIATSAMRALPLGVPKLMISTLASGNTRPFVRASDILMANSVVDILGLNKISRAVLGNAAAAMAGMVQAAPVGKEREERPRVAITMFGVTTPCVERAKEVLEDAGVDVVVFHATGTGGEALESLIREGFFAGVLDLTTTELADELVGGILSAGPTRLTAAAESGIPQVVSVGATDMVNFGARESVPSRFEGRLLHAHNAEVTLMRTTDAECAALGAEIGRKMAAGEGPSEVHLPLRGVSAIDQEGQPFDDAGAREALFRAVRDHAGPVQVIEHDLHINDPTFAEAAALALLALMKISQ